MSPSASLPAHLATAAAAVVARLAAPAIKVVTLTITEKGYCCNLATKSLIEDHPDVVHDLVPPAPQRLSMVH